MNMHGMKNDNRRSLIFACMISCGLFGSNVLSAELAVDVLKDRDTILHLPLDSDFHSISNSSAFPASITTNFASGGSVSFVQPEVSGQYVVDSFSAGTSRYNGGYLHVSNAAVIIDISQFGIGYACTSITVEGYVRGMCPDQIVNWRPIVSMGASAKAPTAITGFEPNLILAVAGGSNEQFYMGASGHLLDGSSANMGTGLEKGLNGTWHHFAAVIEPISTKDMPEGAVSKCYLDHSYVGESRVAVRWHGHSDTGDGAKMYLMLGRALTDTTFDLDELRISKGSLSPCDFIRLRDEDPQNGEPVMRMSFDDGSVRSSACVKDQPSILSGSAGYEADVPKPYIAESKSSTAWRENTRSVVMKDSLLKIGLSNWMLGRNGLEDLTLEFFVKGSDTEKAQIWKNLVQLYDDKVSEKEIYPFLLQTDGNGKMYLRVDASRWNGSGEDIVREAFGYSSSVAFNDGKWHHVAVTIQKAANGTSRVEFFMDRSSVASKTFERYAWQGVGRNGYLGICVPAAGRLWVDEVRISKGVLTPDSFLRAKAGGCIIVVR